MTNEENNKLTEEQKKEKAREYALINLTDNYITNLASVGFNKPEEGRIPKYGMLFSGLCENTIEQTPNQHVYDTLFKEQLKNGGSVNKENLIQKASAIIQYSIMKIKPGDVLELIGSKEDLKQEYGNKTIEELSEDEQKQIIGLYANYMMNKKAGETLVEERKALVGGLEGILCKEKQPNQPAQAA
jgi:hypothetical protein